MHRSGIFLLCLACGAGLGSSALLAAADEAPSIQGLSEEIARLKARLEALEGRKEEGAEEEVDLEALRQAAEEAAGPAEEEKPPEEVVFSSGERLQQALNPEISVIGDVLLILNDSEAETAHHEEEAEEEGHHHGGEPPFFLGRDKFAMRLVELSLQAPLDPFSTCKSFIHIGEGGHVHVCETYLDYANIGNGWGLRVGKLRPTFGVLNRWHEHALPQVDPPRTYNWHFEEGHLGPVGVAFSRLTKPLWGNAGELEFSMTNGDEAVSLAGEESDRPAFTWHLKNYKDLNTSTYLEWGLGGLVGWNDPDGHNLTHIETLDFTYDWAPVGREKYRGRTLRGELFWNHREQDDFIASHKELYPEDATAERHVSSLGSYLYLEETFQRNWKRGLRFDYTELPDRPQAREWGISPYLTFWQSEPTLWRLQFSHYERNFGPDENVLYLQLDWGMGPHRHETY